MPNFTPNFALPYPASTDEPCDFAQQWCDFTVALDAVFDGFQETLDRTVPMIPIALLKLSEPQIRASSTDVAYDTVAIDSAGWTAVDVNDTFISPDMAGVLTFSVNGVFSPELAANAFLIDPNDSTGILTEPNLPYSDQMETNTTDIGINVELAVLFSTGHWIPGVTGIHNNVSTASSPFMTVENSFYAIYWHSDGGTL